MAVLARYQRRGWHMKGVEGCAYEFDALPAHSRADALAVVSLGIPASSAGDNGSFTICCADDGRWQGFFFQWGVIQDHSYFESTEDVAAWLETWWPAMRRGEDNDLFEDPYAQEAE